MGRALERRRFEFLPAMTDARRVLVLGEGDGRFLAALLGVNDRARIDVVDNSGKMLALAERRARADGNRVCFHRADARSWVPPVNAHYDLIVTHFFLDCFGDDDLGPMVRRFAEAASRTCRWVVSEFHQPEQGFPAWRARLWIGALYRLFGWATGLSMRRIPDYGRPLTENGFRRKKLIVRELGLLVSELWERP